jgi:hypothetical protein
VKFEELHKYSVNTFGTHFLFWTLEGLVSAVPFNPLKCIAGLNVQYKKDWCVVEVYPEEQGFGPFT